MIFRLDMALASACLALMALPALLLWTFFKVGAPRRLEHLQTVSQPGDKASDLLGPEFVGDVEMSLAATLRQRYLDAHSGQKYAVPVIVFYVIWILGLLWSFATLYALVQKDPVTIAAGPVDFLRGMAAPSAGFLGGVLMVLPHLFWRAIRSDLQPRTFLHLSVRLIISPFLGVLVAQLIGLASDQQRVALIGAFGAGLYPQQASRWFSQRWHEILQAKDEPRQWLPLRCLHGIEPDDELRLWEEGIMDAQHLACESTVNLLVNTAYPLGRIIDWKDQAFLFIYVGPSLDKWRTLHIRGAMDVLGLAPRYYTMARYEQMRAALAAAHDMPEAIVERFVNTIFNDPRVHQLWGFLTRLYPAQVAEAIGSFEKEPERG